MIIHSNSEDEMNKYWIEDSYKKREKNRTLRLILRTSRQGHGTLITAHSIPEEEIYQFCTDKYVGEWKIGPIVKNYLASIQRGEKFSLEQRTE